MSIFSGMFQNIQSTDTGVEFSFEDIRFNLTNAQLELDYEFSAMENYFTALERLSDVCASIESYDGKLDDAVREFVDHNGEISAALGIALEDDQEENGKQVQEKADKNIFQRAWDAIKRFFTAIWNKIVGFFRWIGNGFKKLPEQVNAAQKRYNEMTPEERQQFLATQKIEVTPKEINERLLLCSNIVAAIAQNAAQGDITKVMETYYEHPTKIYSRKLAAALATFGITVVNEAGRKCEDFLASGDLSFVNSVFRAQIDKKKNEKEKKPLKDMGWNDNTIQYFFTASQKAANVANDLESLINKLEQTANSLNATQMQEKFDALVKRNSGLFNWIFHHGAQKRTEASSAETYRKGLSTICNIYRACLYAIKDVWIDDSKVLNLFNKTPEEIQQGNKKQ